MSSFPHFDNKKNGPTQALEHTMIAEKMYSINFTENNKKFCIITGEIVVYLLMIQKLLNLELKILKLWQLRYV